MEPGLLAGLMDRLADALTLYARQWSRTPEDAVQEAFVRLAMLADPPSNPDAWLFRAVRNGAINAGIAGRRRRQHEAEAAAGSPPWFETDPTAPRGSAVDPEAAQAALATLPPGQREVVVAHLWGGLSFGQVAEVVGTSPSTAHRLYQAGLSTLRDRLGVPCRTSTTRPTPS